MQVKHYPGESKLIITAENDHEVTLIEAIHELNNTDGFIAMLDTWVDMINLGLLQRYNGSWVWEPEYDPIEKGDISYR